MKLPWMISLALASSLALGCSSGFLSSQTEASSLSHSESTSSTEAGEMYSFVFLLAGPREGQLVQEELMAAREGHFGNMKRLADEGVLLIAGPLTDPRADLKHRGIFIFDVDNVDTAREIAETDPGVQLGAFDVEVYPFRSPSNLRRVTELERAAIAEQEADPEAEGPGTRPFLLASAEADSAAPVIEHLESEGKAFFHGTFGDELEGRTIVALDALRKDAAEVLLADAASATGTDVDWTLHGWFSTENVAKLATQ